MGSNPTGPTRFPLFFDNSRRVGRTVRHLSAKQGLSKEANGFNSRTLRQTEGTAEWPATGPENRGIAMSDGRSIRLPSAKFAQVREPGRNGPAVTRSPRVGRGGSNPPLCTKCQRVRIGIAACLRNRCLRVRISPLAPDFIFSRLILVQLPGLRGSTTVNLPNALLEPPRWLRCGDHEHRQCTPVLFRERVE